MRLENLENGKRVTILPGEYYVDNEEVDITTLLGSCVSSCLYDPYNRIIGMNHFLLSNKIYAREMPMCVTLAQIQNEKIRLLLLLAEKCV